MPESIFKVFKLTDRQIIDAFKAIANDCGFKNPSATATVLKDLSGISARLENLENNETLRPILEANGTLVHSWSTTFNSITINVTRNAGADDARIFTSDNSLPDILPKFIASTHTHLRAYTRTETTDKLLGDELAEFYRKREAGLLQLEDLTQKLIVQNNNYRQKLDEDAARLKAQLQSASDARLAEIMAEGAAKEERLKERSDALDKRTKELDDRSSKHARRQTHKDLKTLLADRNKSFVLSQKTVQKRAPIHGLFCLLILVIGYVGVHSLLAIPSTAMDSALFWIATGRSMLTITAFVTAIIFYLRWNDSWFLRHADEEFRLKQLDLDIDRASWVVELALEWKDDGKEIPSALLDRLTANLFIGQEKTETTRHPSEDLASALLGASASLKIPIPGLGEISLNRRGLRDFQKSVEKSDQ